MPRIRDFQVSQSAQTNVPGGVDVKANADDFGGQIGGALRGLGGSLEETGRVMADTTTRANAVDADLRIAKLHQQATLDFFDEKDKAARGAQDFTHTISNKFDETAGKMFEDASPAVREQAQTKIAGLKTQFFGQAAEFEAQSATKLVRTNAEDTLATLQNTVALDPTTYEGAIQDGSALIDKLAPVGKSPGLPADIRNEFKTSFVQKTTNDYFTGRIRSAKSPAEIDGVLTEMADPKFTTRLDPKDTTELISTARTTKNALGTAANAAARASIDSLKSRLDAGDKVDPVEIANADKVVKGAINPSLENEWQTLRARNKALTTARTLPKGAVDDALAQENGLPGPSGATNFPNLPAELNQSVNLVTQATGGQISPSYAARTMERESGSKIATLQRGKPEFQPDAPNIKPGVRDATAVAGEIFGAKLPAKAAAGDAVDIDTSGMKPEDKGRLADALVQAGFTGFAEYGDHLHVDFRQAVPGSFNSTDQFGGWTRLSPEVMSTLLKRGFKAGQSSARIDRNGPDGQPTKTGALDFNFGNDSGTTASGPFQFTESTWLDTLPGAAKKYGIDITGKTRDQLLALRGDPKVSALVFADYTMSNKKTLTAALGREPNDAELYMGHFLGAGGAVNFIRAFQQQPDAKVTDVVAPQAVAANKSVFLDKNGQPKTVSDVYYGITGSFNTGVDALAHERAKALKTVSDEMTALAQPHGDAMKYASDHDVMTPAALTDAQGFAARGQQALNLEEYYKLPYPKPLTNDEVASYKKRIEEGSVSDAVQALKEIGQFGGKAADGAARQIGEQSELSAHLAGLFADGGVGPAVAEDIIKGRRILTENKAAKDWLGSRRDGGTQRVFDNIVGRALDGADPRTRAAIKEASDAYYVQKFPTHDGIRDDRKYGEAINAVIGGRLGVVNGASTIVPKGVTSAQFSDAVDNLNQTDLLARSVTGDAPVDAYDRQISPHTIVVEGKLIHVGGDQYEVMLSDGKYALVERVDSQGLPLRYRMQFDAKSIAELVARSDAATMNRIREASRGHVR